MGKGRKRTKDVKREPNGKISRRKKDVMDRYVRDMDQAEREAVRPGIEARIRHGVLPEHSRDTKAGSFVGRLCLGREISPAQYEAALQFLADWQDNAAAVGMPHSASAVDLNRIHGKSGGENVNRSIEAMQRWRGAVDAVQQRQNELRGHGALYAALEVCVLRDVDAYHMLGWLREGLNALSRHYRIVGRDAA